MATRIREEFRVTCLSLKHNEYDSFGRSKWMSTVKYLIYRWIVAIFFIVTILLDRDFFKGWYTGYFTGWGLATITIYASLNAILCSYQYYRSKTHPNVSLVIENNNKEFKVHPIQYKEELHPGMIWGYKVIWLLFNIAAINSMIVTIGYWGALHSRHDGAKSVVGRVGYHNLSAHLVNALFMILEAGLTSFPVRLLHVVYSQLYGLLYIAQSVIYWLVDGKIFYFFLDYAERPGIVTVVVLGMCFIIQPLFQFFFYGIYCLREWLLTRRLQLAEAPDESTVQTNKQTGKC